MASDLLDALAKARHALATVNGHAAEDTFVLTSSASTDVIDELARYGTVAALDADVTAQKMVLPIRLRQLLDWNGRAANKPTIRQAAAALVARRGDGLSMYPMAVEGLSYAAACAPYLQPDQLAQLVEHTTSGAYAYAPVSAVAKLSRDLKAALGHFPQKRQFTLLLSLWDAAHDVEQPRWWDHCSGRGQQAARGRRRRRHGFEERAAELQAQAGIVEADDAFYANPLQALMGGTVALTPQVVSELLEVRVADQGRALADAFSEWATLPHEDADAPVMAALVADLPPRARPENPLPRMVEALLLAYSGEDGRLLVDQMPEKPTSWEALFPKASVAAYPIAPRMREYDGKRVDPPAGVTDEAFVIELCRNDNELQDNRDYMGNCTFMYAAACRAGTQVIGKIYHGRETYNFAWRHTGGDRWRLQEINGYQNQRQRVPGWVAQWATDEANRLRCVPLQPAEPAEPAADQLAA